MPTTLKDFATKDQATFATARAIAQTTLATAQKAVSEAQKKLNDEIAAHKALETAIAGKRAKLATTSIPAEIEALVKQLTEDTVKLRRQSWKVSDATAALASARNGQAFTEVRLQRADAQLNVANQLLAVVEEEAGRREKWIQAAGAPPLNEVRQKATGVLANNGTTLLKDAQAKLTTEPTRVPQALMEVAELRFKLWRARLEADRDALAFVKAQLGAQAQADQGKAGAAQQLGIAFRENEATFGEWVSSAKNRLDRALSLLEGIAGLGAGAFALSEAEAMQANDPAEPQATQRKEAAEAEKAIYPEQTTADQRQRTLDDELLKAQALDPNDQDLSGVGGVDAATTALEDALVALGEKQAAFDAGKRETMASWQVRLTGQTWQRLLDFFEAKAELEELKATDPAALQTAMTTSEGLYGDALAAQAASARTIAFLQDAYALRKASAESSQAGAVSRLVGAVRGDAD